MTSPFLSMWIIAGGRLQQSEIGGVRPPCASSGKVSLGRVSAQTLSSLSTANPVMPPSFHLFGSGLGHVGSHLYFGMSGELVTAHGSLAAFCAVSPRTRQTARRHRQTASAHSRARGLRPIRFFIEGSPSQAIGLER